MLKSSVIKAQNILPEMQKVMGSFGQGIPSNLEVVSMDAQEVSSALQLLLFKILGILALGYVLFLAAETFFKGLIWAKLLDIKPDKKFWMNFSILNIVWLLIFTVISALLFRIIKPELMPYYLIVYMLIVIYFSYVVFSDFDKKKNLRNIANLKKAFTKKAFIDSMSIIAIFFVAIVLNWAVSFLLKANPITTFSTAAIILIALSTSRSLFFERR
jgi:hypothetical protein